MTGLAWYQKAKLPLGAFSTLLWVQVQLMEEPQEGAFGGNIVCGAVRSATVACFTSDAASWCGCFPSRRRKRFEADPVVIGSVDLNRDQLLQFAVSRRALLRRRPAGAVY